MSFFHVLPSNVAPDTFPRNHASSFSTPISNSYELSGKWEVALMNITYSGCINTFHNDHMCVEKNFSLKEKLETSDKAIRVKFSSLLSTHDLVKDINKKFEGVATLTLDDEGHYCTWKVVKPEVCLLLSIPLRKRFRLWQDVFTTWDKLPNNYHWWKIVSKTEVDEDYHIIAFPPSYNKTTVLMKERNEMISVAECVTRFNERFKDIFQMKIVDKVKFVMTKLHENTVVVFSPELVKMLNFRHAGGCEKGDYQYNNYRLDNVFKASWKVYLYHLNNIEDADEKMTIPITFPPQSFKEETGAVSYLNKIMNNSNISFALLKSKTLEMEIKNDDVSVTFSDTLRDIFAFDQNTFKGKGTFKASDTLSLSRRIRYLYIYSNLSDYIRIGDTQAPLLAVIPFNQEKCVNLLQEKVFKLPMYVSVIRNPISQIDIAIYDGAGELVPFATDAVTSIRLHFQQV